MKVINGFVPHDIASFDKLPAGVYVAQIVNAIDDGQKLSIKVEIVEGEYKGFYQKDFEAQENGNYPPKYRGYLRLFLPSDSGTKSDAINKAKLEEAIFKVMESNAGFVWDWNEHKLAGKLVGINVREASYNGKSFTEIGRFEKVEDVRSGKAKPMNKRQEKNADIAIEEPEKIVFREIPDDEIPF